MVEYTMELSDISIFCPICKKTIKFNIPESILKKKYKHYPFPFRYVHGIPPHSVTLYIDKNHKIRGSEFDDTVVLSHNVIENMYNTRILQDRKNIEEIQQKFHQQDKNPIQIPFEVKFTHPDLRKAKIAFENYEYQNSLSILVNFSQIEELSTYEQFSFYFLQNEVFYSLGLYEEALKTARWIKTNSLKLKNDFIQLDGLLALGKAILRTGGTKKCFDIIRNCEYLLTALNKFPEKFVKLRELELCYIKGRYYWHTGQLTKAIKSASNQLKLSKKYGTQQDISLAYLALGLYYLQNGKLKKSLDLHFKSLNIGKQLKDKMQIAHTCNNIGEIYRLQGKFKLSLQFYEESLKFHKEINDIREISINYYNIGLLSFIHRDFQKSKEKVQIALKYQENVTDPVFLAEIYLLLIRIALQEHSHPEITANFSKLSELYNDNPELRIKYRFLLANALILKNESRIDKIIEARIRLQDLLQENTVEDELKLIATLNLCEVYFLELQSTNNEELLVKINKLLSKLLQLATCENNYIVLVQTFLHLVRFHLIELNFTEAISFIKKAQYITKEYHLASITDSITRDYEYIMENLPKWRNLEIQNDSLKSRINLFSGKTKKFLTITH